MSSGAQLAVVALAAAMLARSATAFADAITTRSAVMFNTVCAQCHELECSRRLSFSSPTPAADARAHIQNYAGPQNASEVDELFSLIEYTKKHCDYYAPPVPVPGDGVWTPSDLAPLATPARRDWFVPLGSLAARTWTLRLSVASDQAIDVEVVSRQGLLTEARVVPPQHDVRLILDVREAGLPHFLRLRSRSPIDFTGAALVE